MPIWGLPMFSGYRDGECGGASRRLDDQESKMRDVTTGGILPGEARVKSLFIAVGFALYGLLWEVTWILLMLAGVLSPALRARIGNRITLPGRGNAAAGQAARSLPQRSTLFFCSSAGEYEQARPLMDQMDRLVEGHRSIVCFFSTSGYEFARIRNEGRIYFLSPPDSPWRWSKIFRRYGICRVVVIRHELWPGLFRAALRVGSIFVINVTVPAGRWSKTLPGIKGMFLRHAKRVMLVDREAEIFYKDAVRLSPKSYRVVGDTKYDQVLALLEKSRQGQDNLSGMLKTFGLPTNLFIVGSAWPADVKILASTLVAKSLPAGWGVVIVPHDISSSMIEQLRSVLSMEGIESSVMSRGKPTLGASSKPVPFLVVDKMGLLTSLYGCGKAAMVGGGFHHKVHNVLEPACYGLPISCGPLYRNSAEACRMVDMGLCQVVTNSSELDSFLRRCFDGATPTSEAVASFVRQLGGASERIAAEVLST